MSLPNQQKLWDKIYTNRQDNQSSTNTLFESEIIPLLPKNSKILELGCGNGTYASYFANQGFSVIATDFSEVAIKKNKSKYKHITNLQFHTLDITQHFPFPDEQFNAVYSRLSLHYFTDKITKDIFKKIYYLLKPGGLLCFICKSTKDPHFGKGDQVEKDMFNNQGHLRHLFSKEYVHECLANLFEPISIKECTEDLYGEKSAFIEVIARKT